MAAKLTTRDMNQVDWPETVSLCAEQRKHPRMAKSQLHIPTFIDLFSGCGGISLGLTDAGFQGLFVVEKAAEAFATFKTNLLDNPDGSRFNWPTWFEKKHIGIDDFISKHGHRLQSFRGKVDVLAGGPPCQGFSFAGKRNGRDPRNRLFRKYVHFVDAVRPQMLVLENVPGMRIAHSTGKQQTTPDAAKKRKSFYDKLIRDLAAIDYVAEGRLLDAASFGVPQRRPRLVVIGIRKESVGKLANGIDSIFEWIEACGREQVKRYRLPLPVTSKDALSDLETSRALTVPYSDPISPPGFSMITYDKPQTSYQRLMHGQVSKQEMDSMRLARHTPAIAQRLALILEECKKGVNLNDADRERYGMLKHRTHAMSPLLVAPTLTTLPDDVVHYSEPRILTVREYARIQSFPDWFKFTGKFTTGGARRKKECPRYTQIGNAVPPLFAEAIGTALMIVLEDLTKKTPSSSRKISQERGQHEQYAVMA